MNIYSFKTQNAPKCNLSASFLKNFPGGGGMPPDPPSISMLRMLIVLQTVTEV